MFDHIYQGAAMRVGDYPTSHEGIDVPTTHEGIEVKEIRWIAQEEDAIPPVEEDVGVETTPQPEVVDGARRHVMLLAETAFRGAQTPLERDAVSEAIKYLTVRLGLGHERKYPLRVIEQIRVVLDRFAPNAEIDIRVWSPGVGPDYEEGTVTLHLDDLDAFEFSGNLFKAKVRNRVVADLVNTE